MDGSRLFVKWLHAQNASLVFTTYQAGKIYFIGLQETGTFSVFERSFDRCMGVCVHENSLWMAARHQLWRFSNTLEAGQRHKGYDAHYVPLVGHTTGDVDVHD
ncbi:MAG: DUF4915 domain-containing protein, partial [Magnetococcales bacterium]|nr:DUF4915 domain-containing protein [Magnetococcales bacterium]